jgi:peptidoglycan/xylan/chitin deacetylase (PgdA/CDA1 family)
MPNRFSTRRWAAATLLPAVACAGLIVALTSSGASATTPTYLPLTVHSSSLTQGGHDLYWRVTVNKPVTFANLAATNRHLCLQLARKPTSVGVVACLADPHGSPRLAGFYLSPGEVPGGHKIPATISGTGTQTVTASFLPTSLGFGYHARLYWHPVSTGTCTGTGPGPAECATISPGGSLKLHVPKLVGCVAKGPKFIFNGSMKVHDIALTFDDGPWGSPPSIDFVNLLAKYHVPATFFEIGDQISEFDHKGAVERKMLADGDMIGDHTWTHPDMTELSEPAQRSELQRTINKIKQETGFRVCLFRAPYGATDPELLNLVRSMGMTTIQWNDDTRDWSLPGTQAIYQTAISEATNGGIIIQHFGGGPRYETLAAIPEEIHTLRAEGYHFVTVTKMLGYKLIYH